MLQFFRKVWQRLWGRLRYCGAVHYLAGGPSLPPPLTPEQEKQYSLIPSPQNHLETVEKTVEQNYNHIDGILNNLPTAEAAVSSARYKKSLSLLVASSAQNSTSGQSDFAYETSSPMSASI